MDFFDLVKYRESVRSYDSNKAVPDDVLFKILEAGRLAPSAANRQPWQFVVVRTPEVLEKVRACYSRSWFAEAPAILAVKGNRQDAWQRKDGYNSLETDLTIAMDHLILASAAAGLGTCWIAAFDKNILYNALNLKQGEEIFAITPLGYPGKDFQKKGEKPRKNPEELNIFL